MALNPEYMPKNTAVDTGLAGKDVLLYVNYGASASEEAPKWVLVGGQQNTPLEKEAAEIDASDKTSGGWSTTKPGLKTWSMEHESIYKGNDEGLAVLEYAFDNELPVHIMRRDKSGKAQKGWAYVTKYSDDNAHDGVVSATISLKGVGPLTPSTDEPDPGAAA